MSDDLLELLAHGIASSDAGDTASAVKAYTTMLEIDPSHASAHINMGTIRFNQRDYAQAEQHYRAAIVTDARYALAYFDLGNVYDETHRMPMAIQSYKTALGISPTYADAHYNLALAYEKNGEPRQALKHWRSYIKLDPYSAWGKHAKAQIPRLLRTERIKFVWNNPKPRRTKRRAKLFLVTK